MIIIEDYLQHNLVFFIKHSVGMNSLIELLLKSIEKNTKLSVRKIFMFTTFPISQN